nr:unnamed protein product [Digitaria exilis]
MTPPPQCDSKPPSAAPLIQVGDMAGEAPPPAPAPKLLYIAVTDGGGRRAFRYTRPVLQSTLHLMGCKPRHAFKVPPSSSPPLLFTPPCYCISKRVFNVMKSELLAASKLDGVTNQENCPALGDGIDTPKNLERSSSSIPFELYKNQTTVVISREQFVSVVCDALSSYKYVGPNQKADLLLACRIKERKESVTILLCGTSGCGKSTLSSLLLMEEYSVYGSEEEADDEPRDGETDEDLTDEERDNHEIDTGSVDEHSTKSDEEYEDLAMRDVMENGDWSDDEQVLSSTKNSLSQESIIRGTGTDEDDGMEGRYHHNLDLFLKMSKEVAGTRMPCAS